MRPWFAHPPRLVATGLFLACIIALFDRAGASSKNRNELGIYGAPRIARHGISFNWAGYAATGGSFTTVTGAWTVPQVNAGGYIAADATWIGIGGVDSTDLIQSGTQNIVGRSGEIETTAFVELLPNASDPIPVAVKGGDAVTVSITQLSIGRWRISFNNNTSGQSFSNTVSYTSSHSSAEWIQEAPSTRGSILPLDEFGDVRFTNAITIQDGKPATILKSGAQRITMMSINCETLATPTDLELDQVSFTVQRSGNSSLPMAQESRRGLDGFRRDSPDNGCASGQVSPSVAALVAPQKDNSSPNYGERWFLLPLAP